jgi:hypothetical protein
MTDYWTHPSSHPDYVSEAPDPGRVDDRDTDEGELMPKTSEMRESKFLKQSDVGAGMLMTVSGCEKHNVAQEGVEPELKWCLLFEESDKPLVLNSTNIQLAERIFDSDNTDNWIGKKIVLYVDPNVSYGGKVVGGIRVRASRKHAKPVPPPPPASELIDDDEIPF